MAFKGNQNIWAVGECGKYSSSTGDVIRFSFVSFQQTRRLLCCANRQYACIKTEIELDTEVGVVNLSEQIMVRNEHDNFYHVGSVLRATVNHY